MVKLLVWKNWSCFFSWLRILLKYFLNDVKILLISKSLICSLEMYNSYSNQYTNGFSGVFENWWYFFGLGEGIGFKICWRSIWTVQQSWMDSLASFYSSKDNRSLIIKLSWLRVGEDMISERCIKLECGKKNIGTLDILFHRITSGMKCWFSYFLTFELDAKSYFLNSRYEISSL